jgi:hypothetical protein
MNKKWSVQERSKESPILQKDKSGKSSLHAAEKESSVLAKSAAETPLKRTESLGSAGRLTTFEALPPVQKAFHPANAGRP